MKLLFFCIIILSSTYAGLIKENHYKIQESYDLDSNSFDEKFEPGSLDESIVSRNTYADTKLQNHKYKNIEPKSVYQFLEPYSSYREKEDVIEPDISAQDIKPRSSDRDIKLHRFEHKIVEPKSMYEFLEPYSSYKGNENVIEPDILAQDIKPRSLDEDIELYSVKHKTLEPKNMYFPDKVQENTDNDYDLTNSDEVADQDSIHGFGLYINKKPDKSDILKPKSLNIGQVQDSSEPFSLYINNDQKNANNIQKSKTSNDVFNPKGLTEYNVSDSHTKENSLNNINTNHVEHKCLNMFLLSSGECAEEYTTKSDTNRVEMLSSKRDSKMIASGDSNDDADDSGDSFSKDSADANQLNTTKENLLKNEKDFNGEHNHMTTESNKHHKVSQATFQMHTYRHLSRTRNYR